MKKVSNYFRESYTELLHKVTWPTWLQLQQATAIVLIATLIITAIVSVMDFGALSVLKIIYSVFKQLFYNDRNYYTTRHKVVCTTRYKW